MKTIKELQLEYRESEKDYYYHIKRAEYYYEVCRIINKQIEEVDRK